MKLRPPSPALTVSFVALGVALGGTATAATLIGTGQLRNNAVTSAKIKDGTVQGKDIKKGTVAVSDLSKGTLKRIDKTGGGGAASTATALEAVRKSGPLAQPANQVVKVASLSLPAGSYVVTAKTTLSGFTPEANALGNLLNQQTSLGGNCRLDVGGDVDQADGTVIVNQRPTPTSLIMQMTRTVGATTNADLLCAAGSAWSAANTSIIATKVAGVSRLDSAG